jgi:predicted DNA-binding ribbon-helix-helix protein
LAAASFAALSATALASAAASASAICRKCSLTFSAADTSIELECVFFSVTPASGK